MPDKFDKGALLAALTCHIVLMMDGARDGNLETRRRNTRLAPFHVVVLALPHLPLMHLAASACNGACKPPCNAYPTEPLPRPRLALQGINKAFAIFVDEYTLSDTSRRNSEPGLPGLQPCVFSSQSNAVTLVSTRGS
jgi:hypothetical protein